MRRFGNFNFSVFPNPKPWFRFPAKKCNLFFVPTTSFLIQKPSNRTEIPIFRVRIIVGTHFGYSPSQKKKNLWSQPVVRGPLGSADHRLGNRGVYHLCQAPESY